jgi:S1-C subfamily serine protease
LNYGVVGALSVNNPGTRGLVPVQVEAGPAGGAGVRFTGFLPGRLELEEVRGLLEAGDLITHVDGVPTPTLADFAKVREQRTHGTDTFTGERLKLCLARAGQRRTVFLPLLAGPAPLPIPWRDARWNLRKDGFPHVFVHDGVVPHDRCGGPVVDRSGRVIGINIARANPIQTFAIPSDQIREVIAELLARAGEHPGINDPSVCRAPPRAVVK